jgi:hypothetical protein
LPGQGLQQFAVDELLDPIPPIPTPPPQAELDALGAESEIVWEDSPVGEDAPRSAADAAVKLIAENISVEDVVAIEAEAAEPEIMPLAPAVPAAAGLRGKSSAASAPAPIENLSAIEKLALFS